MKALASDLDGTLVFNRQVDKRVKKSIRSFQQNNLFGICTGRPVSRIDDIKDIDCDFYIVSTGALILDRDKHVLDEHMIDDAELIFNDYYGKADIIVQTDDPIYFYTTLQMNEPDLKVIHSFDEVKDHKIYGISLVFKTEEEASNETKRINQLYRVSGYQNKDSIDIVARGISKGTGIAFIRKYMHIDEIMGIGDSYNDIPLLEASDISYTFDYSPHDLQERVDHVVKTIQEVLD